MTNVPNIRQTRLTKVPRHPFHIVDPSPWPFVLSVAVFNLTMGLVMYFHRYNYGRILLLFGLVFTLTTMGFWWRDVIREATFLGYHTKKVVEGIRLGIILFIISEVMFFFSIFWAYFHSSLAPTPEIGCVWPPKGFPVLNPYGIPLLNTIILILSGVTITIAHHALIATLREESLKGFVYTLILAFLFTAFQFKEYVDAPFDISDGIYGSVFFFSTGFHGIHVIIGSVFIFVCFIRYIHHHFTPWHHVGFEGATWYWHFVDVVWIFLYLFVYIWGSA